MSRSHSMGRKQLVVLLGALLAVNLGAGWLMSSSASTEPTPVFLPDFEDTLQLVRVNENPADPVANLDRLAVIERTAPEPAILEVVPVEAEKSAEAAAGPQHASLQQSPSALACSTWGPFTSASEARALADRLGATGASRIETGSELVPKSPQYLVYIGPFPNAARAKTTHDELEADGIDAYVLKKGRLRNAVSVGLYAGPTIAKKQLRRVKKLGYNALQTTRKRMHRVHHVSAWIDGSTVLNDQPASGTCPDSGTTLAGASRA